ncbi:MAG TPA: hypothetical protein ENI07_22725 [Desulfobacterales bacterium]|nr:hypothetical protein [Desulfobacterales bacterium]
MPNGVKPTNGNWVIPNELGNELGQVAKGTRNPWSVTPYTIWRPREFLLGNTQRQTCGETGGLVVWTPRESACS